MTGSELTRGETRDRNGPFLATRLSLLGVQISRVELLPDDPARLRAAFERAISEADIVVVSGGLGPTADDHTVRVVGEVFDRPVARDPEAERRMRDRAVRRLGSETAIPENYYKQAEVVKEADVLLNPVGLAPGMCLSTRRGLFFVLPGVPRELVALYEEAVAPRVEERFDLLPPRIYRAKIFGIGESWAEARIQSSGIDFEHLEYGISAKPGEITVKLTAHSPAHHALIDDARRRLEKIFGEDLLSLPEGLDEEIDMAGAQARQVLSELEKRGLTLATAESCTGGLLGKLLTDHSGSSNSFRGSIVAYHNDLKENLLGVPRNLLDRHGAVSREVCGAMATGARERLGADLAVSTTGIAGPTGGSPQKPVGLVYIGLAGARGLRVERHEFGGDRRLVRLRTGVAALELVRRSMKAEEEAADPSS